jgi:hypothetical protein
MRSTMCTLRSSACLVLLLATPWFAAAQDPAPAVLSGQRGGTFTPPPKVVDPLYLPTGPDTLPAAEGEGQPLTLRLTLDVPLRRGGTASLGRATQGSTAASPTLQATLRFKPLAQSYWFAQLQFFRYLRGDRQQAWHPDFSYAFGYEDWHPGSWSLVYANYTGTRFKPDAAAGEGRFNFPQGQWTLGYKFLLPERLEPWLLVGDGDQSACSANLHVMPRYVEYTTGAVRPFKKSASLACRYTRPEGWYADMALYAYPHGGEQQPWDPDFTYGFGWSGGDHGNLTLGYQNYSGNRFPGRSRGAGEGGFRSGSVSASWTNAW